MADIEGGKVTRGAAPGPGSGVFAARGQSGAAPGVGAATPSFVDNGGPVLQNVHLHLIFWGTSWATSTVPTAGAIIDAAVKIFAGPYMNSLSQYRNIRPGSLTGVSVVTAAVASSPADPPNPFSNNDIQNLISNLLSAGRVPSPASDAQIFYCVIVPPGVNTNQGGVIGEHTYFGLAGQNAHYAWVMNNGTLDFVTVIFSHELVETCTDPEGSAILGTPGTCSQGGWCEIGDVCEGNQTVVNGVTVQRYWSQVDQACVVPTDQKVVKDQKDTKEQKDTKNEVKENKESKDIKDRKDHKELKEGAKEKEKEHKELEISDPGLAAALQQLSDRLDQIGKHVEDLDQRLGTGQAFIRPEERPKVGEQALQPGAAETTEKASAQDVEQERKPREA